MFYPKRPLRMLWNMICSQKHQIHKFFHIKGVVCEFWMFSQCWVVSLEKQDKDFQTEKKKKINTSSIQKNKKKKRKICHFNLLFLIHWSALRQKNQQRNCITAILWKVHGQLISFLFFPQPLISNDFLILTGKLIWPKEWMSSFKYQNTGR